MALENENGSMASPFTMPVQPMYGGGYGNGGGFFGGDWAWILLLLLIGGNGWGFGGFGGGMMWPMMMGGMGGGFGLDYLYPWLNNSQHISDGFRDQQLQSSVNGLQNSITSGFGDVQLGIAGVNQNICQTGNGIVNALNSGFNSAEVAANSRQMANMQQGFGLQTAMMQGFNGVQSQAADCCCKTQTGIADLKYTVATENCADRTQAMQNTRDIIDAQTRGTQAIIDKLCQLELDGVKGQLAQAQRDNVGLQNQLNMATMAASQVEQTAALRANQATVANQLVSELRSCPIPSQPVYGNQPIFNCSGPTFGNTGCGCGGNAFMN